MNIFERFFLLEDKQDKIQWIIDNNPKIVKAVCNKLKTDPSFDRLYDLKEVEKIEDPEEKEKAIFRMVANKISENKMIRKYLIWFLREYVRGEYMIEDDVKLDGFLKKFEALKNKNLIEEKDITKYSYDGLVSTLGKFDEDDFKSDNQKKKELREPKQDKQFKDVDIVVNDPDIIIYKPKTWEAERLICPAKDSKGRINEWCTFATEHYFNFYSKDGPLFPMHDLKNDDWYQLHFESDQFKDISDREIGDREGYIKSIPALEMFVRNYINNNLSLVKKSKAWMPFVDESKISPDMANYLKFRGNDLEFLQEQKANFHKIQDEKLLEDIIRHTPHGIIYLIGPSVELQWLAVKTDISAFRKSCPDEIRRYVIEHNPAQLPRFSEYKIRTADGNIKTVYPKDYLTEEDIKLGLSKAPMLFMLLDNSIKSESKYQIFAIDTDMKSDLPLGVAESIKSIMTPETKKWLKETYPEEYKEVFGRKTTKSTKTTKKKE